MNGRQPRLSPHGSMTSELLWAGGERSYSGDGEKQDADENLRLLHQPERRPEEARADRIRDGAERAHQSFFLRLPDQDQVEKAREHDREARAREPERVERESVVVVKSEQEMQNAKRDDEISADGVNGFEHAS